MSASGGGRLQQDRANELPRDLVLMMSPDERFAIVSRERMMEQVAPVSSVTDVLGSMARFVATLTWVGEGDAREQLAALGLSTSAVEDQIAAARRQPTVLERITTPGYRNAEGQEVVRRTEGRGAGGQRIFVLRCGVCGHEYGAYGCDTDIRRCPSCQDGPPGLSVDLTRRA
jgi:hypothetical protein